MEHNNSTELSGNLFNNIYHKNDVDLPTNRLNMFAIFLPYGHVYFVLLSKMGHRGTFSVGIIRLIDGIIQLIHGIVRLIDGIIRLLNSIIRLINDIIRIINH